MIHALQWRTRKPTGWSSSVSPSSSTSSAAVPCAIGNQDDWAVDSVVAKSQNRPALVGAAVAVVVEWEDLLVEEEVGSAAALAAIVAAADSEGEVDSVVEATEVGLVDEVGLEEVIVEVEEVGLAEEEIVVGSVVEETVVGLETADSEGAHLTTDTADEADSGEECSMCLH